jgi:hypothetical protein
MTDIEMLLFWAYEAWAALDHNEHENIASNLFKYIELVQGGLTPLAPDAADGAPEA